MRLIPFNDNQYELADLEVKAIPSNSKLKDTSLSAQINLETGRLCLL